MADDKKYHINPDTGKPNQCTATGKRGCKYKAEDGTEPPHFPTKEAAQEHQNSKDAEEYGSIPTMKKGGGGKSNSEKKQHIDSLDAVGQEMNEKRRSNKAQYDQLAARRAELQASIAQEIEELREREKSIALQEVADAKALLKEHGVAALVNPDTARAIYDADYLEGNVVYDSLPDGEERLGEAMVSVLPYNKLLSRNGFGGSALPPDDDDSTDLGTPVLTLSIPKGTSREDIKAQAEALEPVLQTQKKLNPNAFLDVFEDTLSARGSYSVKIEGDGTYTAGMSYYGSWRDSKNGSLEEAMTWVSENATYGQTEEYAAAHPQIDEDDDDDYY